jgi:hypothetical protein
MFESRMQTLRAQMGRSGIDVALITNEDNTLPAITTICIWILAAQPSLLSRATGVVCS